MPMADATRRSRRGRQGEAERNDWLLLEAARQVFATQGPGASVAAVAARAGIGIGSLYRRYGSKTELLQRLCLLAMEQSNEAARNALGVEDPWEGLAGFVRACIGFRSGALGPLAGAFETTPEMWEKSRRGRRLVGEVLARARRAGALRPDVTDLDVLWLIELFSRHGGDRATADDEAVRRRLVAIALDGLRPGDADPLPAPPPRREHYEGRWRRLPGQDP
jgi:AcrR family transcriptional regulator